MPHFKRGSFLKFSSFMALLISVSLSLPLSAEESPLGNSIDSALKTTKAEAEDLTKLAQEKLKAGTEEVKKVTEQVETSLKEGVEKAKETAEDLKGKAAQVLKEGEDKLQMLLDFGDEKSLTEAKNYVMTKMKGIPQEEAVAKLLKRGVKGLGPWIAQKKVEAGSKLKMKMAYLSRYVDEPAIANTLKKWLKEDADPLVQEYCARALGYQSSDGVLEVLKEKAKNSELSKYVQNAVQTSIAMLEPPKVEDASTNLAPAPALPSLPPAAK
jgi:ElaB/YqjD/DUF883 family membrane-anchored ribosome-binding protein